MSDDLAVWEGARPAGDAEAGRLFRETCDRYLDTDAEHAPTDGIARYVAALLERWPDLAEDEDDISPWSTGPLINEASGPLLYFPVRYSMAEEASTYAADVAASMGLVCYDPQAQRLR